MKSFNILIDFKKIAKETGVRKGSISKSTMLNEWVVGGHEEIDQVVIQPPHNIGDIVGTKKITFVKIISNHWVFDYEFYLTNIELTILNDRMYRMQGKTEMFTQIQDYLSKHTFKKQTIATINYTQEIEDMLEAAMIEKTVSQWRNCASALKENDHQSELSKRIYEATRNCKSEQQITITLTVEELEMILEL